MMKPKPPQKGGRRPMKKTTLSLDAELHKRLRILAIEEGTSMTRLIEKLASEYLAKKGRKGGG
jgi:predicted HicB family RNase H-like nuclease